MGLRIALLLVGSTLALYLGFLGVSAQRGAELIRGYGSYALLFAFALLVLALVRSRVFALQSARVQPRAWLALLLIGAASLFCLTRETPGLRVLQDEALLSATALSLHQERRLETPNGLQYLNGTPQLTAAYLDKRPGFFPLLLALTHDLLGYRLENVYLLNAAITIVLFALLYLVAAQLGGTRAGIFAVSAFASIPLVSQNATGGGFELLNLLMLLLTLLLALNYWRRGDDWSLLAFAYTALLLAQTRYESALYLVFAAVLIALRWLRDRRISIPWLLLPVPLLAVQIPWQLKVFAGQPWAQQLDAAHGSAFSLHYLPGNIIHALQYLLSWKAYGSMNPLLGLAGLLGLLLALILLTLRGRGLLRAAQLSIFGGFMLTVLLAFCVLMGYHWSDLRAPEVSRLALPLLLGLTLLLSLQVTRIASSRAAFISTLAVLGGSAYAYTLPATSKHLYTQQLSQPTFSDWTVSVLEQEPRAQTLVLSHTPWRYILEGYATADLNPLLSDPSGLQFHLKRGTYRRVFVFTQEFDNPRTGKTEDLYGDPLAKAFRLRKVGQRVLSPYIYARAYEVLAVHGPVRDPSSGRAKRRLFKTELSDLRRWWGKLP